MTLAAAECCLKLEEGCVSRIISTAALAVATAASAAAAVAAATAMACRCSAGMPGVLGAIATLHSDVVSLLASLLLLECFLKSHLLLSLFCTTMLLIKFIYIHSLLLMN